jgi:hypothetical protein
MSINALVLESVLTRPHCGVAKREIMPRDVGQFLYECSRCRVLLRLAAAGLLPDGWALHRAKRTG